MEAPSAVALISLLLCSWLLQSCAQDQTSVILSVSLRHVPFLHSQSCDPNSIFSNVLVVRSCKEMSAQWEGQNWHNKRALAQLYIHITHFVLCTFNVPYNSNTQNTRCWKKNSIQEKKGIYNIFGFVFIYICVYCVYAHPYIHTYVYAHIYYMYIHI